MTIPAHFSVGAEKPFFSTGGDKKSQVPLVSITVLNWNGEQHIHRCLEHVVAQTYEAIEVIVVDNGSTDGSLERIKEKYPQFAYIENSTNRGYAAGMNQGLAAMHGDYVIPLCQDVCLDRAFVQEGVQRMLRDPSIGALGGRVFSWKGDQLTSELREREGENYIMRKRFQGDGGNRSDREVFTFAPAGNFPLFRREMLQDLLENTGYYFDEGFGTGWDDSDLFFRMHLLGWKCLFFPAAFGWHVGSGSVGGNATLLSKKLDYQTRVLRNRYFTILKNIPARMLFWLLPYLTITELAIPPYFLVHSPKSLFALVFAWAQVIRALPTVLQKRALIQKSRRVDPMYLKQYFVRF